MRDASFKRQVNRGLAWIGAASSAVGVLDVLAMVLLLKFWLSKAEFGIVTAVVTLFLAFEVAIDKGLAAALIQRDDDSEGMRSTLFWLNLLFALACALLFFLTAPLLSLLHGGEGIELMFQVFSLNLILHGGYAMHNALLQKELRFAETAAVRVLANLADFAVKIATAAAGAGPWCIIWGTFARSLVFQIGLPLCYRWRPRFILRIREAIDHIKFGARNSSCEILFSFYSNLDYQVVNIVFGAAALGVYRAAYELILEPVKFVSAIVAGVAFPVFARIKDDARAIIEQYIAFTRQNLIVILTFVTVIVLATEELLTLLFKPEYAEAASAVRVLAIVGVLRSLSFIGPPLLAGLGYPQLSLRYQVFATFVLVSSFTLCAYLLGDQLGFLSVALGWAVGYPIAFGLLLYFIAEVTGLAMGEYLRQVRGIPICIAVACGAGFVMRTIAAGWTLELRLAVVTAVALASIAILLARFENVTPQAIYRALRG